MNFWSDLHSRLPVYVLYRCSRTEFRQTLAAISKEQWNGSRLPDASAEWPELVSITVACTVDNWLIKIPISRDICRRKWPAGRILCSNGLPQIYQMNYNGSDYISKILWQYESNILVQWKAHIARIWLQLSGNPFQTILEEESHSTKNLCILPWK